MQYYSALTEKEILSHATTWRDLEDITLSEIRHPQKDKYSDEVSKVVRLIERKSGMLVAGDWGRGHGELLGGYRV